MAEALICDGWDRAMDAARAFRQDRDRRFDKGLADILGGPAGYVGRRRLRDGRCDCPPDAQEAGDGWRCTQCGGSRVTPGGSA
jgi:hypothetical protein